MSENIHQRNLCKSSRKYKKRTLRNRTL